MATLRSLPVRTNAYPTTDHKPMAETDLHRELMFQLIKTLQEWFKDEPMVYVSGNLLLFYEQGNKRKHVAPDVFVVKGVPKHPRENYLVWEEGKAPQVVIELTSSTTRREDQKKKFGLYRDVLKVKEYFLFDPKGDYLSPVFQGYSLQKGQYVPLSMVDGRLPSKVLNLHLEKAGSQLRLYNPATGKWLPTPEEACLQAEQARQKAEEENARLRRELERYRH